jgi:LAO/AO transport system kinase
MSTTRANDVGTLVRDYARKDRRALSRLLTLAARGMHADVLRTAARTESRHGRVVGITGSGGVGKSSLIGSLVAHLRSEKKTVAVAACDPQSPLTGGALLGDRIRIIKATDDQGVFVRSLPAIGGHQAIADNLSLIRASMSCFWKPSAQDKETRPSIDWPMCSCSSCSPKAATTCNGKRRA